ncbi:ATP-dependent Clp protease adapter protein ClpS [Rhynchospora pubera]|uniref:ATP-dependent Clp protease adapter protein ClpS n=1 Tax=Rhynchospora pubera TaxID=906938 RepID=A0AAV8DGC0_9POAL|nr:ATP-dependent Clp protease adapter protein ClpS [Rhynchospora pubera]
MAISGRGTTLYPLQFAISSSSPASPCLSVPFKQRLEKTQRSDMIASVSIGGSMRPLKGCGAGVLERPTIDPSQFDAFPIVQEGGDIGRLTEKKGTGSGDSYKVLLVDDPRHTEKLVEKALPQVVPSVTPDRARLLFYESRDRGVAVVIVTVKEHAEFYAQLMLQRGLKSAIEPDSVLPN